MFCGLCVCVGGGGGTHVHTSITHACWNTVVLIHRTAYDYLHCNTLLVPECHIFYGRKINIQKHKGRVMANAGRRKTHRRKVNMNNKRLMFYEAGAKTEFECIIHISMGDFNRQLREARFFSMK